MFYTLLEHAKHVASSGGEEAQLAAAYIEEFQATAPVLSVLPFKNIDKLDYTWKASAALPGTAFRKINGSYSADVGVLTNKTEYLAACGGLLQVDKLLVDTGTSRSALELMQLKSKSLTWSKKFFKGDTTTTAEEFDGLQVRCLNSQLIDNGGTSGGDALSLAKLDNLLRAVPGANVIFCGGYLRDRISQTMRDQTLAGNINITKDDFGIPVMTYNGVPIIEAGLDETDSEILGFTEANPGGGSAVGTSMYAVRFGEVDGLAGIQKSAPEVIDMGLTKEVTKYTTFFEWAAAIAPHHGKCIGRLWGIKDAAVVA